MSLIQLLKFKKWKTRLFKMLHLEMPRFQTGTRVTVASGLYPLSFTFIVLMTDSCMGEEEK